MKNRELAEVLIKILGIYALLQALPLFQHISFAASNFYVSQTESISVLIQLIGSIPFFANVMVGIYLLKNGENLSKKILKEEKQEVLSHNLIDKESLQTILFSAIGLLTIIFAIPKTINAISSIYLYMNESMVGEANKIIRNSWPNILAATLQIIIGFIVFFQAQSVTNLWRSIQRMRYEKRQ
jgi:hypothetical protein